MDEDDLRASALRRFGRVWSLVGVVTLLALVPLLFVQDRLVYMVFWLGGSEIAWALTFIARARLTGGLGATTARVLAAVLAILIGGLTVVAAGILGGSST